MVRGLIGVSRASLAWALVVLGAFPCAGCRTQEKPADASKCRTVDECTDLVNQLGRQYSACDGRNCQEFDEQRRIAGKRADELRRKGWEDDARARNEESKQNQAKQDELEAGVKKRCDASSSDCALAVAELERQCNACKKPDATEDDACKNVCRAKEQTRNLPAASRSREQAEESKAKRAQDEQRKADDTLKLEQRKSRARKLALEKEYAVPALSARLCFAQEGLKSLQQELARERAISQKGGVIDLSAQRSIAESMQNSEEEIRATRSQLAKGYSAQPVACAKVRTTRECMDEKHECSEVDQQRVDILKFASDVLEDPKRAKNEWVDMQP